MSLQPILDVLESLPPPPDPLPGRRRSAVLMPLFLEAGETRVLFILRQDLPRFGRQVAFPGGKVEPDDRSDRETALRELAEELGIEGDEVQWLAKLGHFPTRTSRYDVAAHVGLLPDPRPLRPCEAEVAAVFSLPLDALREQYRARRREAAGAESEERYEIADLAVECPVDPYGPWTPPENAVEIPVVWGVTARILDFFLAALDGER